MVIVAVGRHRDDGSHSRIAYQDVYAGVDVEYYAAANGALEFHEKPLA